MNPYRVISEFLRGPLVIVTKSGVELPLPAAGWDAVEVAHVCAQIERLPETPDRDCWSQRA